MSIPASHNEPYDMQSVIFDVNQTTDKNSDGRITLDEFKAYMATQDIPEDKATVLFGFLDPKDTGSITNQQMIDYQYDYLNLDLNSVDLYTANEGGTVDKSAIMNDILKNADVNQDGKINKKEFVDYLERQLDIPREKGEAAFSLLDTKKAGNLSYEDLANFGVSYVKITQDSVIDLYITPDKGTPDRAAILDDIKKNADKDRDGKINKKEFMDYQQGLGISAEKSEVVFDFLDTGKSGSIGFHELADFNTSYVKISQDEKKALYTESKGSVNKAAIMEDILRNADTDQDGKISKGEFKNYARYLGIPADKADVAYGMLDNKNTGNISYEELANFGVSYTNQ